MLSNVHHGALRDVADGDLFPLSTCRSSDQTCLRPACGLKSATKWSLVCWRMLGLTTLTCDGVNVNDPCTLPEPTVAHDGVTHARGTEAQTPALASRGAPCGPCARRCDMTAPLGNAQNGHSFMRCLTKACLCTMHSRACLNHLH